VLAHHGCRSSTAGNTKEALHCDRCSCGPSVVHSQFSLRNVTPSLTAVTDKNQSIVEIDRLKPPAQRRSPACCCQQRWDPHTVLLFVIRITADAQVVKEAG